MKLMQELNETISSMHKANTEFRESIKKEIDELKERVEKKHVPVSLEQSIVNQANDSIAQAIGRALTDYNSPLKQLVKEVIDKHHEQFQQTFEKVILEAMHVAPFRDDFKEVINKKITREIISSGEGIVEKVSSNLKQDASFKAKVTVALNDLVEEHCFIK